MISRLFVRVGRCYVCRTRIRGGEQVCAEHSRELPTPAEMAATSHAVMRMMWGRG